MARRSIGVPLTVGIVMLLLLLALAAGWQVLVWSDSSPAAGETSTLDWVLLVLGSVFFLIVIIGLVWLCSWLVAEVRLNQRQRAFLDAVTHEMKTPLASFRLGLDTLGRHELATERRSEFIASMQEDLDRLDHTVHKVLAAARAEERGRISRRKQDGVVLDDVIRDSVDAILERHALPEQAIRVECRSGIRVRGDAAELGLIFGNLLENAVKYSDDPIEVVIAVEVSGDGRVRIEIADSGIGIPPHELRKIFRRFYRVGREVQRQVAGLGLGLFVVRNMVRRQGGRIRAKSDGQGHGSRFVVTLRQDARRQRSAPSGPRAEAAVRPAATPAHSTQAH